MFLCLALTLQVRAAIIAPNSAKSENGKFAVDLRQGTELNQILVAVQRAEGQTKTFLWSKTITHTPKYEPLASIFKFTEIAVSNDGDTVVLCDIDIPLLPADEKRPRGNGHWFFLQKNAEPKLHAALDIERLLGQRIFDLRFTETFYGHAERAPLSFFLDTQSVYALWFVTVNKWIVIDLQTRKLILPDPTLTNALNAEATRRAMNRLRQHQPGPLKELLRPARVKLSSWVPRLAPGHAPENLLRNDNQLPASYFFLALRKEPAAEAYIQSLLECPIEQNLGYPFKMGEAVVFVTLSHERRLADLAWRLWNEIPIEKKTLPNGTIDYSPPPHFLGAVRGKVLLPTLAPDKSPGPVWVYLIPATIDPGKWRDHDKVVALFCGLDTRYLDSLRSRLKELEYEFQTITPGTYRLKAVWDRRPPLAVQNGRAVAEPGDYESVESAPFTIAAQQTIDGPALECTNKVGETQAREWFDADEAGKKLQSPAADSSATRPPTTTP